MMSKDVSSLHSGDMVNGKTGGSSLMERRKLMRHLKRLCNGRYGRNWNAHRGGAVYGDGGMGLSSFSLNHVLCYLCHVKSEHIELKEHEVTKWLNKDELESVNRLPADRDLVRKLKM